MISIYMLQVVKKENQNKLGTYQEIAYFYIKDRSVIMFISSIYMLLGLVLSAYAINASSKLISTYFARFFFENMEEEQI